MIFHLQSKYTLMFMDKLLEWKQVIVYFMIDLEQESAQIFTNKEKLSTKHCTWRHTMTASIKANIGTL